MAPPARADILRTVVCHLACSRLSRLMLRVPSPLIHCGTFSHGRGDRPRNIAILRPNVRWTWQGRSGSSAFGAHLMKCPCSSTLCVRRRHDYGTNHAS